MIMEKNQKTVGELFKARRKAERLSLASVELATKIRGKYLVKLEAGDYDALPNDIYTKGFVAKYAEHLGLDADKLVKQYVQERGGSVDTHYEGSIKPVKPPRFAITPRLLVAGSVMIVFVAVIGYLGWQFALLAAAPRLELTSPAKDRVVEGNLVDVIGQAGGGADVYINDSLIVTDGNGKFSSKLALQDGVNTLNVTAKNKLGKATTLTRNILAKLPPIQSRATVPTEKFDGIAIGISAKGAAVGLIVIVDDKQVFNGTMLAGTSQTFRGNSKIKITTNNAGATSLLITNSQVASTDLGVLGQAGEVKRNLEFAKDTNFP